MMRGTPRTFVGPTVLELDGPTSPDVGDAVRREVGRVPGVARCDLDPVAGLLLVTAQEPVDRSRVVEILGRLGLRLMS